MPVTTGKDSEGCYAQWGSKGAKYRYPCGNTKAMNKAKQKAHLQAAAAKKAGFKEDKTSMQIAFDAAVRKKSNEGRKNGWFETPKGRWLKGTLEN